MLSDSAIRKQIQNGRIALGSKFNIQSQVASSSIDLTVGLVFPSARERLTKGFGEIKNLGCENVSLGPGQAVVVQIEEYLSLPNDLGGLMFPPNRLAKNGLIMTNPGHIDPGYSGYLTVCLINMGAKNIMLVRGEVVATLTLFALDAESAGFAGAGSSGASVQQLDTLGDDFADLARRSEKMVKHVINKNLFIGAVFFGIFVAVIAIVTPGLATLFSGVVENKLSESKNSAQVAKLSEEVDALKSEIQKLKK